MKRPHNMTPQDLSDACDVLTGLLSSQDDATAEALQQASGLRPWLFNLAAHELLSNGALQRRPNVEGPPTLKLTVLETKSSEGSSDALPDDARAILAFLNRGPNTAQKIASTCRLPLARVLRFLEHLQHLRLINVRYVGQLNIYRV
ncbi:hypothetical protein [Deinococcus yavapaiensis]|uniref:Uncharacterized protein n=1 Tax=Deinococcus yavapaiensis KR-236 TaxID=694435 RepID=A0A318S1G4_9DEIO|nr:hypothetical protein [Deinococcus yavapaiensis]PYE49983.1 hypothetical protein DES52_1193 [Deinococcus yavapaiensis KR-236]